MPRPRILRLISAKPTTNYFKPRGIPLSQLKEIKLKFEELEALKLADMNGLLQEQAAKKMNISRPTFQRILTSARQKTAEALIRGYAIQIKGGDYIMTPIGRGLGRRIGVGRGRMGGPMAGGPGGLCVCPKCGYESAHLIGQPCNNQTCPKCKSKMVRK